ncbi:MAG: hypothetical protein GTN81_14045 [Proteobacteria bacterium]|nr:hypothetical protein [Pseudomonadota bacterium]
MRKAASADKALVEIIDPSDIEVRESVRLKCLIPLCEYYGVCRLCPPHLPYLDEIRAALKFYRVGVLVALKFALSKGELERLRHDFSYELKLLELVHRLENIAQSGGYREAIGLVVGGCKLCPTCAPPNEPCRHPYKARPSPEGLGIDIMGLALKSGLIVQWPPKDSVVLIGLILF